MELDKLSENSSNVEKTISVIIPTHNSQPTIERCINSLTLQDFPREEYEIIVVDDGSTDKTIEMAKNLGADKVILTKPCFQGKARNLGVQNSSAKLLAFIDSDCEAKNGWLKAISKELPSVPSIGGPIENGNPHSLVAWAEYFTEFGGWSNFKERSTIRLFVGCNGACTNEAFKRTGGFVESEAAEDTLFGGALKKAGLNIYFIPELQIRHLCRTDFGKVRKNMHKLGKFFVIARKKDPSLPYSSMISKWSLPPIFFGKIINSTRYAIHAKKISKFLLVLPIVVLIIFYYCQGASEEISKG